MSTQTQMRSAERKRECTSSDQKNDMNLFFVSSIKQNWTNDDHARARKTYAHYIASRSSLSLDQIRAIFSKIPETDRTEVMRMTALHRPTDPQSKVDRYLRDDDFDNELKRGFFRAHLDECKHGRAYR